MLDELVVGRERLVDLQLLQHVAVVVPHPGRREVGQAHQLAVHHRHLLGKGREVVGVVLGARHVVERLDQALAHEVREGEGRGLRHVDLLAGGVHGRKLGRVIVERRDSRINRHAPVGFELLGDAGVDVAIGPDDEVQSVDLALGRRGPRPGALAERCAGRAGKPEARGACQHASAAQFPFAHEIVVHVVPLPTAPCKSRATVLEASL